MSNVSLDKKYLHVAHGFINIGAICHFNSILQCLTSCTSLTKLFYEHEEIRNHNNLTRVYYQYLTSPDKQKWSAVIWNCLITSLKNKSFGSNQEDASETLHHIIDVFNRPEITSVFEHRSRYIVECENCKKTSEQPADENIVFNISLEDTKVYGTQLSKLLSKDLSELDADFKCPTCEVKGKCRRYRRLTMASDVIIILFRKYANKWNIDIPSTLELGNFRYELIGICDHSGTMSSGHYTAKVLKRNGKFLLNDTSVAPTNEIKSSTDTYLAVYHYV
jgi:ubiquitin C-terminal hydrolase